MARLETTVDDHAMLVGQLSDDCKRSVCVPQAQGTVDITRASAHAPANEEKKRARGSQRQSSASN